MPTYLAIHLEKGLRGQEAILLKNEDFGLSTVSPKKIHNFLAQPT
jgi:hypothetical protein